MMNHLYDFFGMDDPLTKAYVIVSLVVLPVVAALGHFLGKIAKAED